MARVFISYRRKDSATLATLLAKDLQRQGIRAFVDTRQVDGGGPFPDRLRRAIEQADIFVCLLGATTLESDWVREEIAHACQHGKVLIPVFQETYAAPNPIPAGPIFTLLQSDGVHIMDVRNIYIDQSIADLAKMIRASAPRRLPLRLLALALLLVTGAVAAVVLANNSRSTPPVDPAGQAATAAAQVQTPTERPSATPTPRPTDTPDPLQLALTPVRSNDAWRPVERDFDGVTMALVPAGCFMMGSTVSSNEQPVHEQCFDAPF